MLKGLKPSNAADRGQTVFDRVVWRGLNRCLEDRAVGQLVVFDHRFIAASTTAVNPRTNSTLPAVTHGGKGYEGTLRNFLHPSHVITHDGSFSYASGAGSYAVSAHSMLGPNTGYVWGLALEDIRAGQEGNVLIIGTYGSASVQPANNNLTYAPWSRLGTQWTIASANQNTILPYLRALNGIGNSFDAVAAGARAPILAVTLASATFSASTQILNLPVFFDGWNKFTQKGG